MGPTKELIGFHKNQIWVLYYISRCWVLCGLISLLIIKVRGSFLLEYFSFLGYPFKFSNSIPSVFFNCGSLVSQLHPWKEYTPDIHEEPWYPQCPS